MSLRALNAVNPQAVADQHEDRLTAAYYGVLAEAGRTASNRFLSMAPIVAATNPQQPQPNWTPPNIDELVDLAQIGADTAKKTRPIHLAALTQVLGTYQDALPPPTTGQPSFTDVKNPYAKTLLDKTGGRAGDVSKSIRDDLQKIIGDSYEQGLSVTKTADQIVQLSDQFSRAQSRMLARVDLNGLANGGSVLAAKEVGVGYKTWTSANDDLVRPTHQDANEQTVPIDAQFDVGGESADYPCDPELSDAEACGCRCTVTYTDSLQAATVGATIGGQMAEIMIPLTISVGQAIDGMDKEYAMRARGASRATGGLLLVPDSLAATGQTDLPLSDRDTAWDAGAARKTLQPSDFPKAHFWRDPDGPADQIGSYKLPFAQRIDGKLTAIWRGVTAGVQRLDSTQGIDKAAVQTKMGAYYRKAAKQYDDPTIKAPWDGSNSLANRHPFMDGGDGTCAECGMSASAAVHTMTAAALGEIPWRAVLCVEGTATEDGRLLEPGSITWRALPLTLLCQLETQLGHDGAEVCGRIDRIYRDGSNIIGEGVFDAGECGVEAARLVDARTLRGVSVDLAVLEYEVRAAPDADDAASAMDIADGLYPADDADTLFVVTSGVIGAATICAFQAIEQATIQVLQSSGRLALATVRGEFAPDLLTLTASVVEAEAPLKPPAEWFDDPKLTGPTLLTVTDDGRVFGHVAPWKGCHTGFPGRCVPPPHSRTGYAHFHVGRIETAEGDLIKIGRLTLAAPHADIYASAEAARRHYDNSASVAAFVRAGEDEYGPWIAGALRPGVSPRTVQDLLANPLSGDWRNGEMIAAHAVPVAGFPILQASAIGESGGEETALILTSTIGVEVPDYGLRARVLAARARGGLAGLVALARS